MAPTLLQTKLYVPPVRPESVSRPRLVERLNAGLHRKLTLVSAPAGFGKTTLVSEWIGNREYGAGSREYGVGSGKAGLPTPRFCWLSLDESDNDLTRFLTYLIMALQTIEASMGQGALSVLQSPQLPPVESILTPLINETIAISGPLVLVLDDYHLIEAQPIHDALTFLVRRLLPPAAGSLGGLHLVISTREDPPLPLARLRARSHLTELRAADLRFTSAEAAEFLNQATGLDLSAQDVTALEGRTEGWIAGLQLAALGLQGAVSSQGHLGDRASAVAGFIESFAGSHRFVLDYLIEEVLDQQPARVQEFLLQTAILDRMSGALCDLLTGQEDGQATLEELERANLFIVPLDEERRWYRYHHLFVDLLQQRLRQLYPERVTALHAQASAWYAQNGFHDEAIEHALQSEDFSRAADLLQEIADDLWQFGGPTKLRRWLEGLPESMLFCRPHLCIFYAWSLYASGEADEADRFLRAAERALGPVIVDKPDARLQLADPSPVPDEMALVGRAAAVRSCLVSYRGDVQGAIQHARRALEYLPERDAMWRWCALDSLGTAYSGVDEASAYQARSQALEASKAAGNVYTNLLASLRLVVTLRNLGRLQQAIEICRQGLALANENGLSDTALVGWLYALWGEVLAEKNELDRALQWADKGVRLTARGRDVILRGSSYLCLMRVLFSRGDLARATELIQEVDGLVQRQGLSPWITVQMAARQARIWVAQGKLDAAARWAARYELDVAQELAPMHDFGYRVLARLLTAQKRFDEASRLLPRLLDAAEAGGRTSKTIEILILQALAFQAQGELDQARALLERALALAEPGGFIRTFVDEGPQVVHLLYEALSRDVAPDYVRRLLAAFPDAQPGQADSPAPQAASSDLIEPLSERELEVLQLVAQGLTNPEIAARLYLSLNTVKVHTRNIYGKLGVHNRTQAVARAQALGLLIAT